MCEKGEVKNNIRDKQFNFYFKKYLLSKHSMKFKYICIFSFPYTEKKKERDNWSDEKKIHHFRVALKRLLDLRRFEFFWIREGEGRDMCIFMLTDWVFNDYHFRLVWKYDGDEEAYKEYLREFTIDVEKSVIDIKPIINTLIFKLDHKNKFYEHEINIFFDRDYIESSVSIPIFIDFRLSLDKL